MGSKTLIGWGYVYHAATGELLSEGTVVVDPMPANFLLLELPKRHDTETFRWDAASAGLVPFTNADRISELGAERDRAISEIARLQGGP